MGAATDTGISARKATDILRPFKENLLKFGAAVGKAEDTLIAQQTRLGLYAVQALAGLTDAGMNRDAAEVRVLREVKRPGLDFQTVRKWSDAGDVAATLPKAVAESLQIGTLLALAGLDAGQREAVAVKVLQDSKGDPPKREAMRQAVRDAKGYVPPSDADRSLALEKNYRDDSRVIRAKLAALFGKSAKERNAVLSAALLAARICKGSDVESFQTDALKVLLDWTTPEPTDSDE